MGNTEKHWDTPPTAEQQADLIVKNLNNEKKAVVVDVKMVLKPTENSSNNKSLTIGDNQGTNSVTSYSYKTQQVKRIDRRVSLNVAPVTFDASGNYNSSESSEESSFAKRVAYVLGKKTDNLNGTDVYGFLHSCLSQSCGLVFPYTPNINISHQVNYDKTDITHSNLSLNHYKNTPPPTYTVDAVFTADSRENALHMLSAIWFLRAVTKCDFGEHSTTAGTPPPVLYLNGYNQMMDNIPVVVKSFNYSLPKDKDYVPLGINLDSGNFIYNDREVYSDSNGQIYEGKDKPSESGGMQYINGLATALDNMKSGKTSLPSNRYNSFYFNTWLPMEMNFNIVLEVQPNLLKHKKVFDLNTYKMGIYNLGEYKDNEKLFVPSSNGLENYNIITSVGVMAPTIQETQDETVGQRLEKITNIIKEKYNMNVKSGKFGANNVYAIFLDKTEDGKGYKFPDTKTYKFNKSGFTW